MAAAVGLLACSSSKGGSCSDVVNTPGGPRPKVCVYEVPNGSTTTVDDAGTSIVTVNGKVVATHPPCPCAPMTCTDSSGVAHPVGLLWLEGCMACQCANINGALEVVCTHNACPPDASADATAD
jgi:hypothetical protein